MKTPHLLASLAVAATAAAADLKDPAEVAREWNETVARSTPAPWTRDLSLRGTTAIPPLASLAADLPREFEARSRGNTKVPPWRPRIPRNRLYDAPGYLVPKTLPDQLPPGSKPWEYGGQTYWLIPLIPSPPK